MASAPGDPYGILDDYPPELARQRLEQPKLLRNAASCLACGDTVESGSGHYFRACTCGRLSVDGGLHYLRRSHPDDGGPGFVEASEWESPEQLAARLDEIRHQVAVRAGADASAGR